MICSLKCFYCKSTALIQEYEGAEITCTKCGIVGCVEQILSLSNLEECLETKEERLHKDMEAFAESNIDLSDCFSSLKIKRKIKRKSS
jgi:transcription initiation factor TFIIIB Brf1 subunit/transcription initiation factor TFIIB